MNADAKSARTKREFLVVIDVQSEFSSSFRERNFSTMVLQ